MFTCCLLNYSGTNPRYMISTLLFSTPKSLDVRHRDISAEVIVDWSDPGQLTSFHIPFTHLRSQVV